MEIFYIMFWYYKLLEVQADKCNLFFVPNETYVPNKLNLHQMKLMYQISSICTK